MRYPRRRGERSRTTAAFLGALVVGVSVAACGSGSEAPEKGEASNVASNSAAPGVNKQEKTILLGATGPKSGPNVIYENELYGAEAYFKSVDAKGGIDGWKIKYTTLNDEYNPSKTPAEIKQLVENEKVFALANVVGTTEIKAIFPLIEQTGTPLVAPASGRDIFEELGYRANMFPVGPSFHDECALLARYAVEKLGAKKLALFYSNDAIGEPARPGYQEAVKTSGAESVGEVGYPVTATDFSAYALRLKKSGADTVVTFAGVPGTIGVEKAAAAIGYKPRWLAAWFVANAGFFSAGGQEGTYFDAWLTPPEEKTSAVEEYEAALKQYTPSAEVGPVSQQGYVDAVVTVAGLKKLIESGKPITQGNLVSVMDTLQNFNAGMAQGVTYTTKSHLGVTTERILEAKEKHFVTVTESAPLQK